MKRDDMSMADDPNESPFVRELLQAGRRSQVDYDLERGLAEHLARIGAGAALPTAAEGVLVGKAALPSWVGLALLPLMAAGVATLAWVFAGPTPEQTRSLDRSVERPARSELASEQVSTKSSAAAANDSIESAKAVSAPARSQRPEPSVRHAQESARPAERHAAAVRNSARAARPAAAEAEREHTVAAVEPELMRTQAADSRATGVVPTDTALAIAPIAQVGASESRLASAVDHPAAQHDAEPEPAAQTERQAERDAPVRREPAATPAKLPIEEAQLEREMQMLAVTQRVLESDPGRALRLAEQGEREFPRTMFSAERRQLALLAMVKLGRVDEARRTGRPFLAKYPKAPWSERLRRALASGNVE